MPSKVKSAPQWHQGGTTKTATKKPQHPPRLNTCASYDDGGPIYDDMMLSDAEFFFGEDGFFS